MFGRDPTTGAILIAGKRVPPMVIGIVLAAVVLLLILRARSKNANLVNVGQAAAAGAGGLPAGYDPNQLAIANLSESVTQLQNEFDALGLLSAAPPASGSSSSSASGTGTGPISPVFGGIGFYREVPGITLDQAGTGVVASPVSSATLSGVSYTRQPPRPV